MLGYGKLSINHGDYYLALFW